MDCWSLLAEEMKKGKEYSPCTTQERIARLFPRFTSNEPRSLFYKLKDHPFLHLLRLFSASAINKWSFL
jgi:hypothetical protein